MIKKLSIALPLVAIVCSSTALLAESTQTKARVTIPAAPLRIVGGPPVVLESAGIRQLELAGPNTGWTDPKIVIGIYNLHETDPDNPEAVLGVMDGTVNVPLDSRGDAAQIVVPMAGYGYGIKVTVICEPATEGS